MRQEHSKRSENGEPPIVRVTYTDKKTGKVFILHGTIHGKPTSNAAAGGMKTYRVDIISEDLRKDVPAQVEVDALNIEWPQEGPIG